VDSLILTSDLTLSNAPKDVMLTPGLFFVISRVKDSSLVPDADYNIWYNDEHIPDLLRFFQHKGQIDRPLALRYKNSNPDSDRPYLALYPLPDAQWMFSPDQAEFRWSIKQSRVLGVDNIFEHIEFTFRPYEKIQTFEGYQQASKTGVNRSKTIVCVAMEPGPSEEQQQELDDWYRKQHLDMLSMCKGYRRSTRYKRMDDQAPKYLALHEYDCKPDELPADQIDRVKETDWSKKILAECQMFERDVFELIEVQGNKEMKL
jgi:hypothetical protein